MTNANLALQFVAGLIVIGAAINMPAWGRLLIDRLHVMDRPVWYKDPFVALRAGMALLGPAVAAAYAYWGIKSFLSGNPGMHPVWFYMLTRTLIALAEALFIYAAFLLGLRRPAFAWIIFTGLWSAFCIYWGLSA